MENQVFVYRIGENLFCLNCIKEAEKALPKDSGVQLPKKPLTAEEVDRFICKQCKKIFEKRDLLDVRDLLKHSLSKIQFIRDFFGHQIPEDEYFGNQRTIDGLCFILGDIEDHIEQAIHDLGTINLKNQGKEVKENGNIQARG